MPVPVRQRCWPMYPPTPLVNPNWWAQKTFPRPGSASTVVPKVTSVSALVPEGKP
jgi:hypothetical protein